MFDINFYMKVYKFQKEMDRFNKKEIMEKFEEFRSKEPIIYNIETTNNCNLLCRACPRTRMTRPIATMSMKMFKTVVDQLRPWTSLEWENWLEFVRIHYELDDDDMSENHFFLYVIPKTIILHGYGDPLFDIHIVKRVQYLFDKDIPSYFSCNACNITVDKGIKLFEAGLDYLKFSTDSSDDFSVKQIRGKHTDFSKSYKKILQLLDIKETNGYNTEIVITMLNLKSNQSDDYQRLCEKFEGREVYIYLKSQDQLWHKNGKENKSIHWIGPCWSPWSSITILADGNVAPCHVDYNNELPLGHVENESLKEIWNGEKYKRIREDHFNLNPETKCMKKCDMGLIGEYL